MDPTCETARRELATAAGQPELLPAAVREHLESCDGCREELLAWRRLHAALEAGLPAGDRELHERVLSAVTSRRGMAASVIPLLASLGVAAGGASLLRGIPGVGFLGVLPAAGVQAGSSVVAGWGDLWLGVVTAVRTIGPAIPGPMVVLAGLFTVIGGLLTTRAVWASRRTGP